MSKFLTILFRILEALLILVPALFLIFWFLGIRPFIVMSGSMEPVIPTGSICFVDTKASYSEIEPQDTIAFTVGNHMLVTHRVIRITEKGMETKGDANEVSDLQLVTDTNYIGKTMFSIPYLGYLASQFQKLFEFFYIKVVTAVTKMAF